MDVHGRRVLVMGLGSFSGGVSAARYMARCGARVVVTDAADPVQLAPSLAALDGVAIESIHLGGHRAEDFEWAEVVVVSPAVRDDSPLLAVARSHGAVLTTEMNLFLDRCPARVVGVTGSNGKSTTAAMIHAMLEAAGRRSWLGGNIGRSLLERVDDLGPADWVVLELSSFQLEKLGQAGPSPHAAVVTTFTPNHLDRHGSLDEYRVAKQAILQHQAGEDLAVLNADDPDVRAWPTRCRALFYGLEDHGREGAFLEGNRVVVRSAGREVEFGLADVLRLPGRHNLSNAVGAACCAAALGASPTAVRQGLATFRTLPHRLELVGELDGRRFYDDSIATTPESTLAALESLDGPLWLIAGGHDKGLDLEGVARRMAARVSGVALIGQTAPALAGLLARHERGRGRPAVQRCPTMPAAVAWCFNRSNPGDSILLSPACASFGMFRNFVDRAGAFRRALSDLRTPLRRAG